MPAARSAAVSRPTAASAAMTPTEPSCSSAARTASTVAPSTSDTWRTARAPSRRSDRASGTSTPSAGRRRLASASTSAGTRKPMVSASTRAAGLPRCARLTRQSRVAPSQHRAINAVLAGQHTVIKGPPGTGKSQTIANLIATLVARGQRVLFVAEKRAAISAVTDRLARCGLDSLVMDVHDGTAARRRIAADLKAALDHASRIALPDLTRLHETLADRRSRLNDHVASL